MKQAWIVRALSAVAGLAFGLVSAELSFGKLRPAQEPAADPVLYSLEVRDGRGTLLASPMLVGEAGRPLHLNLSRDPRRRGVNMSLDLDPQPLDRENLCLGYRLSVGGGAPHRGSVGVAYGQRRSLDLRSAHGSLHVELVVARASTGAFDRILRARRRPSA
jgi:hypothetical protein